MKNNLSQEPTYTHIQLTCYRLTECEQTEYFLANVHIVATKKRLIILLFTSLNNLIDILEESHIYTFVYEKESVICILNPQGT